MITAHKLVEQGIQTRSREANRNQVRVLLSGSEEEAIKWLHHHRNNESFLKIAGDLVTEEKETRRNVIIVITELRAALERKGVA